MGEIQRLTSKVTQAWSCFMVPNLCFLQWLNDYTKGNVNVVVGGAIGKKTYIEAIEIFELLAKQSKRNTYDPSKAQGSLI